MKTVRVLAFSLTLLLTAATRTRDGSTAVLRVAPAAPLPELRERAWELRGAACGLVAPAALRPEAVPGTAAAPLQFVHVAKCGGTSMEQLLYAAAHRANLSLCDNGCLNRQILRTGWKLQAPWRRHDAFVGIAGWSLASGFLGRESRS